MLTQILLTKVEAELNKTVKTKRERSEREMAVLQLTSEPNNLLNNLEASSVSFLSEHGNDVRALRQQLQSILRRARNATFYQSVSTEEMKAIKIAMQTEFHGSGHWYRQWTLVFDRRM